MTQIIIEEINDEIKLSKNGEIIYEAAMRVYNQLGYGLSENAYQNALSVELFDLGNSVQTEYHVSQYYISSLGRRIQVADLRIDILLNDNIILELKTVSTKLDKRDKKTGKRKMEDIKKIIQYKQCNRYKKLLNIDEGYLINFGEKGLDFILV